MNVKLHASSEFASLVNELHQSPNNPELKQAVLRRLPEMKALAQVNPLALYRLAQVFPKSSAQYEHMMRESAAKGCTNAMFAMCELLLNSKLPTSIEQAADYLTAIYQSQDSYIIKQSRELIAEYPEVLDAMRAGKDYQHNFRFFTAQHMQEDIEPEMHMGLAV